MKKYKEAIPLSVIKPMIKGWDKERLKDWFDGKYRVYIPLINSLFSNEKVSLRIELEIKGV